MSQVQEEEEELDDFELQLKQEELEKLAKQDGSKLPKGTSYTDDDGTVMEWDHERKAYFPRIDADFIAQYQINYGASNQQTDDGWQGLSEEEKQAKYDEYWNNYYQAYSKEQPKPPKFDIEGNEIEDDEEESSTKKAASETSKAKKKSAEAGDAETDKTQAEATSSKKVDFDPTSDEHYEYNLYYYGQEYADEYRDYYRDHPEEAAMPDWYAERGAEREESSAVEDSKKKGKKKPEKGEKRKEPSREEGWFDVDTQTSTQVYVSGLPDEEFTDEEFNELMSKCGLIMFDPLTHKPKLRLYKDKEGHLKGDGLCTYIKAESVELALNILDGFDVKGRKISVEKAKFELKGAFDPKKKKKKLSNKAKQKLKEKQQRLFDWRPDKNPYERPKHERIVILKNMFDVAEFDKDPTLIQEFRTDVREECTKFGEVSKVMLYDRNPEGVISVMFKEHDDADKCIAAMNGRWFAKRQIRAAAHDGKTKYEVQETDEERAKRLAGWDSFLSGDTDKSATSNQDTDKSATSNQDTDKSATSNQDKSISGEGGGAGQQGNVRKVSGVVMEDVEEPDGVDTGGTTEAV